jgi:hypothetical protein
MYIQQAMDEVQLLKRPNYKVQFVLREVGTENTDCRNVVTPDWWLEVTMHPEDHTTGQINHDFPWGFSALEQMLDLYRHSKICCTLLMQLSQQ